MSAWRTQELKSRIILRALHFFVRVLAILPRFVGQGFFQVFFFIAYFGMGRLKKVCHQNLTFVYGNTKAPREYAEMVRACLKTIGESMIDMLYFVERPEPFMSRVRFHGEDHLKQALGAGRGVIAVSAHLGNFPLMFEALVRQGHKVNVIIRPMRDEKFGRFMQDLCAKWQIRMIETTPPKTFLRECFAALKRHELLFILLDESVPPEEGVPVEFFGSTVTRAVGPMLFHERVGSPIVPVFIAKDAQGRFDIFIEKAVKVETGGSAEESTRTSISRLTKIIESFVRQHPLQWGGWLNKRWLSTHAQASKNS